MKKTILIALFAAASLTACEPETTDKAADIAPASEIAAAPLPPEMMYQGQPIDPMCFQLPMEQAAAVDMNLADCRGDDMIVAPDATLQPDAEGAVGYQFGYDDGSADPVMAGVVKYYYLGLIEGNPAVLTVFNGGGSGTFTNLATFARSGDSVRLMKNYAGGDRCNGGVTGAEVKDGVLSYRLNATPYDLIALGSEGEAPVAAYEDLEASASSCFATVLYQDQKPMSVALDAEAAADQPDWTNKYPHQACFNALQREYIESGRQNLSMGDVARFAADFKARCLKI